MPVNPSPIIKSFTTLVSLLTEKSSSSSDSKTSDSDIRKALLRVNLVTHMRLKGPCPCPDMYARDDSRCGSRSSWSRSAKRNVTCFPEEIHDRAVEKWRKDLLKLPDMTGFVVNDVITLPGSKQEREIEEKVDRYLENMVKQLKTVKAPDTPVIKAQVLSEEKK